MKKHTEKTFKIATIGFLVLSMGIILFPVQRTPSISEVQFVRNKDQLQASQTHGAASQWDYLFEDTGATYGGQLNTGNTSSGTYQGSLTQTTTQTTTTSSLLNAMQQNFNQVVTATGGTYQGTLNTTTGTLVSTGTADCITPRGQKVADKDFVLAYQQRQDVTSMCNIERRICTNGVLEGSYTQNACKENVVYDYTKTEVVSYNEPVVNPLVQPGQPSNAGADVGTNGQVNQVKQPTSMRGSSNTAGTTSSTAVTQTSTNKQNCSTPRGTTVNHGQFVKAYKTSVGLLDMPCETQLRLCVDGALKGTFLNKTCTFKNITYNDYIAGNTNFTTPTPQDLQGTLTNQDTTKNYGIWDRIKGVFK